MINQWGKFTAKGGSRVEQTIFFVVTQIARVVKGEISHGCLESLLLIGGYGRGEGGIETRDDIECPHNNLDFLLVTSKLNCAARANLQHQLDLAVAPLVSEFDLGIDFSVISSWKLRHFPCEVMWYDARHGHKTILGSDKLLQSLEHLRLESVDPVSMRDLLVNRGTLLVINELLLSKPKLSEEDRRTIIKHTFKAIIGYGDAALFFRGQYHWSYLERQRRMQHCTGICDGLHDLYQEATQFRFRPDYERYREYNISLWLKNVRSVLEPVHLNCESKRLSIKNLTWPQYPTEMTMSACASDWKSPKSILRKYVNYIRHRNWKTPHQEISSVFFRSLGFRDMLAITYPVVAYELSSATHRELACEMLGAESRTIQALRIAYLKAWGSFGDSNFAAVAERLGLSYLNNGD